MTEEQALLNAVIAEPHLDAPRLIYADWLSEQGRIDRAEFIRVQCALAVIPDCLTPSVSDSRRPCRECRPRNKRDCLPWCEVCERFGDLSIRDSQLCKLCNIPEKWLYRATSPYPRYVGLPGEIQRPVAEEHLFNLTWSRGFITRILGHLVGLRSCLPRFIQTQPVEVAWATDATIWPSGGNDTYYLGGLGAFPSQYWKRLEGFRSRHDTYMGLSAVMIHEARENLERKDIQYAPFDF